MSEMSELSELSEDIGYRLASARQHAPEHETRPSPRTTRVRRTLGRRPTRRGLQSALLVHERNERTPTHRSDIERRRLSTAISCPQLEFQPENNIQKTNEKSSFTLRNQVGIQGSSPISQNDNSRSDERNERAKRCPVCHNKLRQIPVRGLTSIPVHSEGGDGNKSCPYPTMTHPR